MKKLPLQNKSLLEPGAGSGLISIYAAQNGATVTATDVNPIAVEYLGENSRRNNVRINIIESDIFSRVPAESFDIIAINPPYYKKNPESLADYAWYCGENGEYFENLFSGLKKYMHSESVVLMVLCDGCDIGMIKKMADQKGYEMNKIQTKKNVLEKNFIYRIELKK